MKKWIAVPGVLLLLAALIGLEGLVSDHRVEPRKVDVTGFDEPVPGMRPRIRKVSTDEAPVVISDPSPDGIALKDGQDPDLAEPLFQGVPSLSGAAPEVSNPQILYLRGQSIVVAYKPDKKSIARLQLAVQQVVSKFESPVIIFDLDGLVASHSPFLSYANSRFDITGSVQTAYQILKDDDASRSQGGRSETGSELDRGEGVSK